MNKYTLKIDGMMCSMCEAHMNDVIRKTLPGAKKVSSSHSKGITSFVCDDVDTEKLSEAIKNIGYELIDIKSEPYEKKFGLF